MSDCNCNKNTNEDLRKWFGKGGAGGTTAGGWDRYGADGQKLGKCGDAKEGDPYAACLSAEKAKKLGKDGIAAFVKRKRAAQKKAGDAKKGGEEKKGQKPVFVKTGVSESTITEKNVPTDLAKWSYYKSQAKKKFDVYPCVPLNSLAVTKQGLKSYYELIIGEDILSYNMEKDQLEWTPIKNLHYYENADLMEIKKATGFKFRCTPNHKWVIKRAEDRNPELIEAKNLTTHMRMVFSANMNDSISKSNLLNENWGKHDTWVERIVNMTPSEREVWLSSAIVYDGWEKGKSTKVEGRRTFGFSQKNRDHLLSTIYAAYLNGYYVSVNDFDKDIVSVTIIRGKQTHGTQNVIKTFLDEKEDVWCPETKNQTWVMVQNGWFTITGNSAYANAWAAKKYKAAGGKWKTEEAKLEKEKFTDPDQMRMYDSYYNEELGLEFMASETPFPIEEAEYQGKKVELGKVKRGGSKKFYVYVKDGDKVKKVSFGDTTGLTIKTRNPERRKSFRARHNCDNPGPKTKARYWSCKMWSGPDAVKKMTGENKNNKFIDMKLSNFLNEETSKLDVLQQLSADLSALIKSSVGNIKQLDKRDQVEIMKHLSDFKKKLDKISTRVGLTEK